MGMRFREAVVSGYPSGSKPQAFPERMPRSAKAALQVLDCHRPTTGNLADSESWRRMIGGRQRYNNDRQQTVRARRNALLIWLMNHRMFYWCGSLGKFVPDEKIAIQHGDGAMLAKALDIGKATVCRDLSALQAVHPLLFGRQSCGVTYSEYMCGWRYAHRSGLGNKQPHHNLRFPKNQRGAAARALHAVARALDSDATECRQSKIANHPPHLEDSSQAKTATAVSTVADFLQILRINCPDDDLPAMPVRRSLNKGSRRNATA